jgi:hypothetical protein
VLTGLRSEGRWKFPLPVHCSGVVSKLTTYYVIVVCTRTYKSSVGKQINCPWPDVMRGERRGNVVGGGVRNTTLEEGGVEEFS